MKHTLFIGLAAFLVLSCSDENIPEASWNIYEMESLSATAGNKEVTLEWTPSEKRTPDAYYIKWTPGSADYQGGEMEVEGIQTSATVTPLTNRVMYTFTVQPRYGAQKGAPSTATAMPKSPYADVDNLSAKASSGKVTLSWSKPSGTTGTVTGYTITCSPNNQRANITNPETTTYAFTGLTDGTEYKFVIVTHYDGGDSDGTSISRTAGLSAPTWTSVSLVNGTYTGFVKASNPVFSPDGETMYVPSSNKQGDLFAIDVMSGTVKWVYPIANVTYGGGAAVGNDGTIYQGDQKGVIHAISSNGDKKWTYATGGKIEDFPAVTSDNVLYVGVGESGTSSLYAIDGSSGSLIWKKTVDGNVAAAVAVDASGNVYLGTNKAIYSFTSEGTERWTSASLNVTERGSFSINGTSLYAALKAGAGVASINMTDGSTNWTSGIATGDAYFPIVGTDGSVYFTDKGSQMIIAVNADGSKKWSVAAGAALIYAGLALDSKGILYTGTQSMLNGSYLILGVRASDGTVVVNQSSGEQMMSAFTIGEDGRLYFGTVAGNVNALNIAATKAEGWSMRGGNYQGTNSLK